MGQFCHLCRPKPSYNTAVAPISTVPDFSSWSFFHLSRKDREMATFSTVNTLHHRKSLTFLDFPRLSRLDSRFRFKTNSASPPSCQQFKKKICFSASASKTASDFEVKEKSPEEITNWALFAKHVSGEWDGHGAEFTHDGKPIELPENVVPEAFREWEVQVFDWQTQCSTLAQTEEPVLMYKLIKLLPTVGCEADAATKYSIEEKHMGGLNNEVCAFAYDSSGSYVAVWPGEVRDGYKLLEIEHCLMNPHDQEGRVRIIQILRVEKELMSLQGVNVFREHWFGPFRNGEQLGGCAIRDSAFATTEVLKESEVVGVWQGFGFVANFDGKDNWKEFGSEKLQQTIRDVKDLVLLPKQLWCSLRHVEDNTIAEVGWLIDNGMAVTSKCDFSKDGTLDEIAISRETTTS